MLTTLRGFEFLKPILKPWAISVLAMLCVGCRQYYGCGRHTVGDFAPLADYKIIGPINYCINWIVDSTYSEVASVEVLEHWKWWLFGNHGFKLVSLVISGDRRGT
jgi:hypothetical protein